MLANIIILENKIKGINSRNRRDRSAFVCKVICCLLGTHIRNPSEKIFHYEDTVLITTQKIKKKFAHNSNNNYKIPRNEFSKKCQDLYEENSEA